MPMHMRAYMMLTIRGDTYLRSMIGNHFVSCGHESTCCALGESSQLKGREPEWPNPKLNVRNCLKAQKWTKNQTPYSTKSLKFSKI